MMTLFFRSCMNKKCRKKAERENVKKLFVLVCQREPSSSSCKTTEKKTHVEGRRIRKILKGNRQQILELIKNEEKKMLRVQLTARKIFSKSATDGWVFFLWVSLNWSSLSSSFFVLMMAHTRTSGNISARVKRFFMDWLGKKKFQATEEIK